MPKHKRESMRVSARPLEPTDWKLVADLFGERGACGGCWCMAWRLPTREFEAGKGASHKRRFKQLVTSGVASGILAFVDDEVVGWCSVGPRSEFCLLESKWSLRTEWDEGTWSVTCFFIKREWRGRGVGSKLLKCAVDLARDRGARSIEGYPVVPSGGFGSKMPAAFAWTGLVGMFERERFRALPNPPGKRPIYLRKLRSRRFR